MKFYLIIYHYQKIKKMTTNKTTCVSRGNGFLILKVKNLRTLEQESIARYFKGKDNLIYYSIKYFLISYST